YESLEDVTQKLNYLRELSANGLDNLTDNEIELLIKEFNTFFNLNLSFFADTYPTKLFRVTNNKLINGTKQYKLQKISNLIGPPEGVSGINRCNLKGESIFYAALDLKTALWETQPQKDDYITVSEWSIKPGQRLNNHFIFHPTETNLNKESRQTFEAHLEAKKSLHPTLAPIFTEIMKFFAEEFMKKVDEDKKINYLFSSSISSRLLQTKPDSNGFRIESISYPSIKLDHKVTNIAILNSLVLEKLNLNSVTIYTVMDANYDEALKDSSDFVKVSALQTFHKSFDFENDRIYYDLDKELKDAMKLHEQSEKQ
ncbi:MAG: RES domain-containing protein, partial [Ignavibacteria bacterium]|nr:RES domain-containing protein [Ignavibacteria bacterium]